MKKFICLLFATQFFAAIVSAQTGNIGIATISPNSKLHVEGSIALGYREITGTSSLSVDDYAIEFKGATEDSINLPDATSCSGRIYYLKNSTATATLRIHPILGQLIDGAIGNWSLYQQNEVV